MYLCTEQNGLCAEKCIENFDCVIFRQSYKNFKNISYSEIVSMSALIACNAMN